jgi:hypothetical protein
MRGASAYCLWRSRQARSAGVRPSASMAPLGLGA